MTSKTCKTCTYDNPQINTHCDMCDNKLGHKFERKEVERKEVERKHITKPVAQKRTNVFFEQYSLAMMAGISDLKLKNALHSRAEKLGVSKNDYTKMDFHLSLLIVLINKRNPDSSVLVDEKGSLVSDFVSELKHGFNTVSARINLNSTPGKYEAMGDFMAKMYEAENSEYITMFRICFYKFLERKLGYGCRRIQKIDSNEYYIYSYRGRDLIAVQNYYHGRGKWTPHLSLVRLGKVKQSNPALYAAYEKEGMVKLAKSMKGATGYLDKLNMKTHFNDLRVSVM